MTDHCLHHQATGSSEVALILKLFRHHAYLEQWTPSIGEVLSLKREPDNSHDSYSVAVVKGETVVGHVPRPANRVCFHFLGRDGLGRDGHPSCRSSTQPQHRPQVG